jgi:glucose-1-phosphate cytidylyltransferase
MKVVLFCGGQGLRIRAASSTVPKPLLEVGDQPILLHLMKYYAHHGHTDFILCLGYKAHTIKQYFLDYNEALHNDFVLSAGGEEVKLLNQSIDTWRITFVDTGRSSNIGDRLAAVRPHLEGEEYFLANYGDQLTDAPLPTMIDGLVESDKVASLMCVKPTYSTHILSLGQGNRITGVGRMDNGSIWINGGFFVFRHDIFDYMREGEELVEEPFARLIADDKLLGYRHEGFWAPMDTLKDKMTLDALAETATPPWAVWSRPAEPEVQPLTVVSVPALSSQGRAA